MVLKRCCDRCGAEIVRSAKFNTITIKLVIGEVIQDDEQYKEICSVCHEELDGFLNGDC
jgi:hypothetical protein